MAKKRGNIKTVVTHRCCNHFFPASDNKNTARGKMSKAVPSRIWKNKSFLHIHLPSFPVSGESCK